MLVFRDSFARMEIHRELVNAGTATCAWCGQSRYWRGVVTNKLYRYRTEDDSGRKGYYKGLFCSSGCFHTYHD